MASSDTALLALAKASEGSTTAVPATPKPATDKPATAKPAATTKVAPTVSASDSQKAFKIVKVRKPDGTIIKVRRPIPPGSSEASSGSPSDASKPALGGSMPKATTPTATAPTRNPIVPTVIKEAQVSKPKAKTEVKTEHQTEVKPADASTLIQTPQSGAKPKPNTRGSTKPATLPTQKQSLRGSAIPTTSSTTKQSPNTATQGHVPGTKRRMFGGISRFSGLGRVAIGAIHPDLDLFDGDDDIEDGCDIEDGDEPVTDDDDDDEDDNDNDDDDDDDDKKDEDENDAGDIEKKQQNGSDMEKREASFGRPDANEKPNTANPAANQQTNKSNGASTATRGIAQAIPNWLRNSKGRREAPAVKKDTLSAQAALSKEPAVSKKDIPSAQTSPSVVEESKSTSTVEINEKQIDVDSEPGKPQLDTPRNLERPGFTQVIVWLITTTFPLLFLILGVFTSILDGAPASSWGVNAVEQAIKIAVTSWPIFFAAIVAQSLKALATYRVERGIRLMTLEQLISSNSFASAVKQPFFLRRIDFMSIGLLALWSLSPLASQAMQRMSEPVTGTTQNRAQIWFLDTNGKNPAFTPGVDTLNVQDSIASLFDAAMLPRGQQDPTHMDAWRYPLVPSLFEVAGSKTPNASQWYTVNPGKGDTLRTYSSPLGIPYMDLPNTSNGTYNFTLNSSYFSFSCPQIKVVTMQALKESTVKFSMNTRGTLLLGITPPTQPNVPGNLAFASLILRNTTTKPAPTVTSNGTYAYAECNFTQIFVQSDTFCDDRVNTTDCKVQRIRLAPGTNNFVPLDDFSNTFVDAGTPELYMGTNNNPNMSTFFERYLFDPPKVLHNMVPVDLTNSTIDAATIERRLGRLFNAYWQAGFAPMYQTGFYPEADKVALGYDNFTIGKNHHSAATLNITATFTDTTPKYIVYAPWLGCLLACSIILLVVGVGGVIWEYRTVGPNILGFANSIVRQSKKVKLPVGTALSGPERTRIMGDLKVMMQDVRPKADVGKIALGTVSDNSQRLQPGRFYL